MANVEIQWDFDKDIKKYRFETFCYGPKSCEYYKMGKSRAVSYKNRGSALDDVVNSNHTENGLSGWSTLY